MFAVGETIGLLEENCALLLHENGAGKVVGANVRLQVGIDGSRAEPGLPLAFTNTKRETDNRRQLWDGHRMSAVQPGRRRSPEILPAEI